MPDSPAFRHFKNSCRAKGNFYSCLVFLLFIIGGHPHWKLFRRYPTSDIGHFNLISEKILSEWRCHIPSRSNLIYNIKILLMLMSMLFKSMSHCPLSIVHCPLSVVRCPCSLSIVHVHFPFPCTCPCPWTWTLTQTSTWNFLESDVGYRIQLECRNADTKFSPASLVYR